MVDALSGIYKRGVQGIIQSSSVLDSGKHGAYDFFQNQKLPDSSYVKQQMRDFDQGENDCYPTVNSIKQLHVKDNGDGAFSVLADSDRLQFPIPVLPKATLKEAASMVESFNSFVEITHNVVKTSQPTPTTK